jgi:hypothetical protein
VEGRRGQQIFEWEWKAQKTEEPINQAASHEAAEAVAAKQMEQRGVTEMENGEQQKWKMGEQRNKDKHTRWRRALEDDKTCRYTRSDGTYTGARHRHAAKRTT